jgi:hypothetical protein
MKVGMKRKGIILAGGHGSGRCPAAYAFFSCSYLYLISQ